MLVRRGNGTLRGLRALLEAGEPRARDRRQSVGSERFCCVRAADEAVTNFSIRRDLDRGHDQALFDLPTFLTRRDAWAAPFNWLFEDLAEPRVDAPMHLPEAPLPTPRPGDRPWGTDCDDTTRRMRRSILAFEKLLGVDAPPRLHACAHTKPHWGHTCAPGTMVEATAWLGAATRRWLAPR